MRTLILNIGNTHTQAAEWRGDSITDATTMPSAEIAAGLARMGFVPDAPEWRCLAACVAPLAGEVAAELGPRGDSVVFLSARSVSAVDFSGVDTTTLGADRVANAVAAVTLVGAPCIVLDCGTAVTVEVVDGSCRFRGGAILPGRHLLRQSLNDHTAQLPYVALGDDVPHALGTDTVSAILAGVDRGVLGAIEAVLDRTRHELGSANCPVVVTGGDAGYFCRHLTTTRLSTAPPWFTLSGVATIASDLWGSG